jgi:predicted CXXCH cytochrome family protein
MKGLIAVLSLAAATILAALLVASDPPHNTSRSVECASCHMTHSAPGGTITTVAGNASLCISCHQSGGGATNKAFADANQAYPLPGLPGAASGNSHRWDSGIAGHVVGRLANTSTGRVTSIAAYTGLYAKTYTITITGLGGEAGTAQFLWNATNPGGASGSATTGSSVSINNEITLAFTNGAAPSFKSGDQWYIYVRPNISNPSTPAMALRAPNGVIMCSTCHDQHLQAELPFGTTAAYGGTGTGAGRHFQRIDNNTDQMCKECHSAFNVTTQTLGSHPVGVNNPIGNYKTPTTVPRDSNSQVACQSCHQVHFGPANDGTLRRVLDTNTLCVDCHTNSDTTSPAVHLKPSTAPINASGNYQDTFTATVYSYNNSTGTTDWSTLPWIESDTIQSPTLNNVRVLADGNCYPSGGNCLRLASNVANNIYRATGIPPGINATAFLSYSYRINGTASFIVQISTDSGSNWTNLVTYTSTTTNTVGDFAATPINISSYTNGLYSPIIRFYRNSGASSTVFFYVDNVNISYSYTTIPPAGALWPGGQFGSPASTFPAITDDGKRGYCTNCHQPHGWPNASNTAQHYPKLLVETNDYNFCITCHDGSPTKDIRTDVTSKTYKHPVNPAQQAPNRPVECRDCHNVHKAQAGSHDYNATATSTRNYVSNPIKGVSGLSVAYPTGVSYNFVAPVSGNYGTVTSSTYEYQICFKCHSAKSWNFGTAPNGMSPNGTITTPSQTDLAQEFSPRNMSGHPVVDSLNNYTNSPSPKALVAATQMRGPWTAVGTQTMMCSDCHNTDEATPAAQGPHGSAAQFMLRGPNSNMWPNVQLSAFTTSWCYNCHATTAGHFAGSRTAHTNRYCYECHIVIPHGGKLSRLMADNNGVMPARYAYNNNKATIVLQHFSKNANAPTYSESNCGSATSGCTNHSPNTTADANW